jgi:hypothetical protein
MVHPLIAVADGKFKLRNSFWLTEKIIPDRG